MVHAGSYQGKSGWTIPSCSLFLGFWVGIRSRVRVPKKTVVDQCNYASRRAQWKASELSQQPLLLPQIMISLQECKAKREHQVPGCALAGDRQSPRACTAGFTPEGLYCPGISRVSRRQLHHRCMAGSSGNSARPTRQLQFQRSGGQKQDGRIHRAAWNRLLAKSVIIAPPPGLSGWGSRSRCRDALATIVEKDAGCSRTNLLQHWLSRHHTWRSTKDDNQRSAGWYRPPFKRAFCQPGVGGAPARARPATPRRCRLS